MEIGLERIYQDLNFSVGYVNGQKIEELFGIVLKTDADDEPIIVHLKLEKLKWQRFFLDAFIGFWEVSNTYIDELDSDTKIVDYAKKYNLVGKNITSAVCENGEIKLLLSEGSRISLVLKNPSVCDTDSKLLFEESIS